MLRVIVKAMRFGRVLFACGHIHVPHRRGRAGCRRPCASCREGLPVTKIVTKKYPQGIPSALHRELERRAEMGENTPEVQFVNYMRAKGLKFVENFDGIPGHPIIAFPEKRKAIYLYRDVWQGRIGRVWLRMEDRWRKKIALNVKNRKVAKQRAHEMGWATLSLWANDIGPTALLRWYYLIRDMLNGYQFGIANTTMQAKLKAGYKIKRPGSKRRRYV